MTEQASLPGARLRSIVRASLREQRVALGLAAFGLCGVVLAEVLAGGGES